ncbi:MAG: hypothetical protein V8Q42_09020 [Anaerovoracaceae bacterium]
MAPAREAMYWTVAMYRGDIQGGAAWPSVKSPSDICGSGEAFAYPYRDCNDSSVSMVKDSGSLCAMTTQPGEASPGQ